jgi:N-methylhydantoinase A
VLLPPSPGALSALGVLTADVVKEQTRTVMLEASAGAQRELEKVFTVMEKQATATLRREGFPGSKQRHERSLAARYKGQSFELQIKQTNGNIAAAFHRAHLARYGYAQEKNVVEIVSARLRSIGVVRSRRLSKVGALPNGRASAKPHDWSEAYFERGKARAAIYRREDLRAGARLRAPCIVTEYSATTIIPTNTEAELDEYSNIIIRVAVGKRGLPPPQATAAASRPS